MTATDTAPQTNGPEPTSFPKDRMQIVLCEGVHPIGETMIADDGYPVRAESGALSPDDLAEALSEARVIGIRSKTQLTAELIEQAPKLLAIGAFCTGTNQIDLNAAAERGIPVFNAPFSNTRSVAELTIAEVVALHRRMADRSRAMHEGVWDKSAQGSHEIRGRVLGIVGYGHIGSQVSVLAEAMGMRVIYYDVDAKLPLGNARPMRSLEELLEIADAVTLHVPATGATTGMIGEAEFRRMKPSAYIINNARGGVVDVGALAEALRAGRIAGAAVDVFPDEPASRGERFESELRGLPNVILTPHIGGSTLEAQANIAEEVAGKLLRFINSGSTMGAVNVPQVDLPAQARSGSASELRPHRVLNFHRNVPGVLGKIHQAISGLGANVAGEYLQTHGQIGYVVLDVDPSDAGKLGEALREIPESIRTRVLW